MAEGKGYFSRSWALIGKEPGWYKVPLVMGIANFVPIAGPLGTSGECIKSGWRGFASTIGWGVLLGIIMSLVASVSHGGVVPFLLSLVIGVFGGTILAVCCVRAAIYQNFKAGYRADRIFEMLKRDFGGIARIAGLCILISLIITLAMYLIALVAFIPLITKLVSMAAYTSAHAYSSYAGDSYTYGHDPGAAGDWLSGVGRDLVRKPRGVRGGWFVDEAVQRPCMGRERRPPASGPDAARRHGGPRRSGGPDRRRRQCRGRHAGRHRRLCR